ncbi:MAG: dynamin family protein [Syntrophobacterales bacterium]|nr:dynamin family protein [Syntrophobacterales bacterium]
MSTFESAKSDLLQIKRELSSIFDTAKSMPGINTFPFDIWRKAERAVEEQINENILSVAVVGAIKSGKSTFINALLEGDYLKRGAGVVTSIVTKIRKGSILQANLIFKTWEDVNSDIEQAMVLFPSLDYTSGNGHFDIRREKDRNELREALNSLCANQLIFQDTRDMNSVLLSAYLKGYERVAGALSWETNARQFKGPDFPRHKDFVGNDSLAVYLRDLELQIPARQNLNDNMEIADCQGSDSPNPLHLAMIQDYLLKTHLIIYLLSSRTGVRQADIKFLSMIKKMGLMENIIFVINCDFNEHESLDDLKALVEKTREDISIIKPDPEIFTFSALFDLLKRLGNDISEKDRLKREQWEMEPELRKFSDCERERFQTDFYKKLTRDRFNLLLKNHLARFAVMTGSLQDWVKINSDILSKNADDAVEVVKKITYEQEQMDQIKSMVRNTLDGTAQKIKRELATDINRFLDVHYGDIIRDIREFVRNYHVDLQEKKDDLEEMGLSATLYIVFQEFKNALDLFMAEKINLRLIHFAYEEEKKINDLLNNVAGPYNAMVKDTISRHKETLKNVGVQLTEHGFDYEFSFSVDTIKKTTGLRVPPLASSLQYTAKVRTEAILRLGYYNFAGFIKKLFKKSIQNQEEGKILALRDSIKRIKRETERSLVFHLGDYRENLKFQYIYKLVDVASNTLYDMLFDRFQIFTTDISEMMEMIGNEHQVKKKAIDGLANMDRSLQKITYQIEQLKTEGLGSN